MSRFEALFIRVALVYLVLTGLLGAAFYLWPTLMPYFRVTHVHIGVVGFFLSFVMGVAYWMMPRLPGGVRQEGLEAVTFVLLHGGLAIRVLAEPAWRYTGSAELAAANVVGAVAQVAAFAVFAYAMNARVRSAEAIRRLRRT
jgi:hypothetical protein